MDAPQFRIKHIALNTPSEKEVHELCTALCSFLGLAENGENNTHIFAGDLFEIMKNENRGKIGHVALQPEDVDTAVRYFAEKGIGILENTIKRDSNGRITFVYLDIEIGGLAFHLTV